MLFPELDVTRFALVNLNDEAKEWLGQRSVAEVNPLLDPMVCQAFINDCHLRLGVDFSYGGWLEDRRVIWRGSYLDDDCRYIHLGVDFNVPAGTSIMSDKMYTVIRIDSDYPEEFGWGTRVFLQEPSADVIMIFAHLDPSPFLRVGIVIQPGDLLGSIGMAPSNGHWFSHLHVQVIDAEHYTKLLNNDLRDLDGYGRIEDIEALKGAFFDPMNYVSI